MTIDLAPFDEAFQGLIPAVFVTCSEEGIPNIIGISHVYRIDQNHVALSEQFMRRSRENLERTGRGEVLLVDPTTGDQRLLTLRFVRRETEGPVVSRIRAKVDGIAAATGMAGVFAVKAALVCEVTAVKLVPVRVAAPAGSPAPKLPRLAHLGQLAERIHSVSDLGSLASLLLNELAASFGFQHSMLLLSDETGQKLFTLHSRGFPASGVGSEVRVGEGLLGHCAQTRLPVRITSFTRERMYAEAAGGTSLEEIPLPGLPGVESMLAVPVATRDQLVGLIVLQSPERLAFSHDDEVALTIVARLAASELARLRSELPEDTPAAPTAASAPKTQSALSIRYFEENDSIFLNGEYLVKGVAGRILWIILRDAIEQGRTGFTNKELRLDPRLGLSALNDNLEARMLLLRRRLEECGAPLRLPATGRGRFRFECDSPVTMEKVATGRV